MKSVRLLGVPTDANSSFLRGAAAAPPLIRKALHAESSNLAVERGGEIGRDILIEDLGDLVLAGDESEFAAIRDAAATLGAPIIALGGDHAITYPLIAGLAQRHGPVHILHIDAHPDLYDAYDGNRFSHASPFARIMEEGLASSLTQVGIRTLNDHCRAQAARFGVKIVEWQDFDARTVPLPAGAVYVTIDLDGLDPAFCPGVSHPEPGGLSVREVLTMLHRIEGPVVGADIVEYNPLRDVDDLTAHVAAKFVKELASAMTR